MVYELGQRHISGLFNKIENAVSSALVNYTIVNILRKTTGNASLTISSYPELAFQVSYIPVYNARVKQTKTDIEYYLADRPRALVYNQGGNLIETRYYGENMKGVIARLGNLEKTYTYMLDSVSKIPKAGELFNDDYYISTVSNEYLPYYIKCTIGLSKDFNRLSQFVGINSAIRQFIRKTSQIYC